GINFHGFLGVCGQPTVNGKNDYYTPICAANPADATAKIMTAGPEYYGLWMAGHLGPGMFQPVTVAGAGNLVAYAVKGADGATRIALIDKEPTGGMVPVTVTLAGAGNGTARVIHLTGPSLAAPAGAQIQGAALDHDGHLAPGAPDPIEYSGGSISLALPTGSAAILTVGSPGEGGGPDRGVDGGGDARPGGGPDGPAM